MAISAAERIVIDDGVLQAQSRALSHATETLASSVGAARSQLSGTSFGALNAFLAGSMNQLASRTAELVAESSRLAQRMNAGVDDAQKLFSDHEGVAATGFAKLEEGL